MSRKSGCRFSDKDMRKIEFPACARAAASLRPLCVHYLCADWRRIKEVIMTASRFTRLRISYFFVGFAIVSAGAAQAQQQQAAPLSGTEAGVVVIGEGSISAAPDYAELNGGVTTRGKSVKEATDANSTLMAAITAALQDAGIAAKDIQTSRFSIQSLYTPADPHNESKLAGYSVSNQVNVTIRDIGKAGDILDRLATAGVTNVGNIEFLHSDPSILLDQARAAAVADAKRKAEIYAKASGIGLGRVVWIAEDAGLAAPMPMMARMAAAAPMAPVPISAGEDALHVRITVGFAIAN
jgi:uncharacterized protein